MCIEISISNYHCWSLEAHYKIIFTFRTVMMEIRNHNIFQSVKFAHLCKKGINPTSYLVPYILKRIEITYFLWLSLWTNFSLRLRFTSSGSVNAFERGIFRYLHYLNFNRKNPGLHWELNTGAVIFLPSVLSLPQHLNSIYR